MISFNFDYFKAESYSNALAYYSKMKQQGKLPFYLSGGTELLTFGRMNQVTTEIVIDITAIPECNAFTRNHSSLTIGVGLTLNEINEKQAFPLLDQVISEIADHTSRNKITLGGNICAKIIYQEALLPFLLTDSLAIIATKDGVLQKSVSSLFNNGKKLTEGEILLSLKVPITETKLPYYTVKKRKQWNAGYPLITFAIIYLDDKIRIAFSGLTSFAFRSTQMEDILNNQRLKLEDRVKQAIDNIPHEILDDVHGSAAYRKFVLEKTLLDILATRKEGNGNG